MFDETYFTAAIHSFLWREFNYETHSTYKAKTTIIVWCVGGAAAAERVQQPRHAGNRECLWGVQEAQEEQGRSWSLCQWQKTEHLKLQPFTEWGGGGLLLLSPDEGGPFPPHTGQGGSFSPSLDEGGPPPPLTRRGGYFPTWPDEWVLHPLTEHHNKSKSFISQCEISSVLKKS